MDQERLERESERRACYIVVGTNVLDPARLSEEELIPAYKVQGGVEGGFRFLKDPLFLASSVLVKKPERIEDLSFVMVVCLLVYRLAEQRLRKRLAESGQSIPNQVGKPSINPTMRWVFQFFEGIDILHIRSSTGYGRMYFTLKPCTSKCSAYSVPLPRTLRCPNLKLRNVGIIPPIGRNYR